MHASSQTSMLLRLKAKHPLSDLIVAMIVCCVSLSAASQPKPLPLPPQPLTQAGLSVLPPDEPGWLKAPTDTRLLVLGRYGSGLDETYTIDGRRVEIHPFASPKEFLDQVDALNAARLAKSRFNVTLNESAPSTTAGAACVRTHIIAEDSSPVRRSTGMTGPMTLEILVLTCPPPTTESQLGFVVSYSHRHQPGSEDPKFTEKAARFLDTVSADQK